MKDKNVKPRAYRDQQLQALSVRQAKTIDALAARIFPTTDTPGAVEAGAVFYIDQALAGPYPELRPYYTKALRALASHAKEKFAVPFLKLSAPQQDAVLKDFESGNVTTFTKAADFFETVRAHILEGVFGEPNYGGNKNLIGWKLVGFPGQQYGYPDAYINRVVDLEPVACEGMPKKPGQ
ncbi:MAG: gluconate 2-dehydrogenase subunit 3 family protein [Deltaproteobacteria bacterium]|nr:gluconate 2-dehydrogenase subunit 3 family protein [Deltaproteobacteria bacterium]MBM4297528.1 gluconate 2-dehydrogenase subunit 3 family protein [Deltaproteobacteria bacterium]